MNIEVKGECGCCWDGWYDGWHEICSVCRTIYDLMMAGF